MHYLDRLRERVDLTKIKLVASDMDGTLLDADGEVPSETFELIEALHDKGIHFAASSGRRYDRLCEFFAPVKDKMDFVAANGAQVYASGELVDREVFSHLGIRRMAKTVGLFENMHMALFDSSKSFLLSDVDQYVRDIDKDLPNAERIWELPGADANIIKVSIFCGDGHVMDYSYVLSRELGDEFVFAPSGTAWIDVLQRGVSKASGIEQIMNHRGATREQTMAFGDSMNDYEIIRFVKNGMAMENARPALKTVARCVIGTNAEHAVQEVMRALIEAN